MIEQPRRARPRRTWLLLAVVASGYLLAGAASVASAAPLAAGAADGATLCYPTPPDAGQPLPMIAGEAGSRPVAEADRLTVAGAYRAAAELYHDVLAAPGSRPVERDCAARGLAVIALTQSSPPDPTAAQRASSRWNAFFAGWIRPTLGFGVPALAVFVFLLAGARVVTPLVVSAGTPGSDPDSPGQNGVPYWTGVGALAVAAVTLTAGLAATDGVAKTAARALESVSACYLVAAALLLAATYPLPGTVDLAGERGRARVARVTAFLLAALLGVLAVAGVGPVHWGNATALILTSAVLVAGGLWLVARVRGTALAMLIEGKGLGDNDSITAEAVRVRLHAMGSQEPRGLQIVQQADVTALPGDALSLLPDGALAKAAGALVKLFQPSCPWRLRVTRTDDATLALQLSRNGRLASSGTVRLSELGLLPAPAGPPRSTAEATSGSAPEGGRADADLDHQHGAALTAAAAFALVELSHRHPALTAGLHGAVDWRSVAAHAIATEPGAALDIEARRTLLAYAVSFDSGNLAALAGWVYRSYPLGASPGQALRHVHALRRVYDLVEDRAGGGGAGAGDPLAQRLLFNLAVGWVHYAEQVSVDAAGPAAGGVPDVAGVPEPSAAAALAYARWYLDRLEAALAAAPDGILKSELLAAARLLPRTGQAPADPGVSGPEPFLGTPTMLVRYERACARLAQDPPDRAGALVDLMLATRVPGNRSWARTDPSFRSLFSDPRTAAELADARQFKAMVGDPVPQSLLELATFDKYRADLRDRGVRGAAELAAMTRPWLVSELKITPGLAGQWQNLAELELLLAQPTPDHEPGDTPTGVLFALLQAGVDSATDFRSHDPGTLRAALLAVSASLAVVVPSRGRLAALAALGAPDVPVRQP
jgi:hypothetical protein